MNKQIQILLLFLSISMIDRIKAQNVNVDSLENLLKLHKTNDNVKVNLLNETAYAFYLNDKEKTLQYATQASELSDKVKFLKGKAESLLLIGMYHSKSNKSLAFDYYQQSMKIAESINYKTGIAKCWNAYGTIYSAQDKIPQSIDCYTKAIRILEEINDKLETAKYVQNLASAYTKQGNNEKAIEAYRKAIKILEELDDKYLCAVCLNNLGAVYERIGNKAEALECYQKSLKFREKLTDKVVVIGAFYTISKLYFSQDDYQNALIYLQKALKIAEEINNKHEISSCYERIGNLYISMNNPQALEYLLKGLKIMEELSEISSISITSNRIGDFYAKQKNDQKALEYYQKALTIAEEIGRKSSTSSIFYKIGKIYLNQNKYSVALSYTLKSLAVADELKMLSNQKEIHFQLSKIYAATNDYKNAYQHHKTYKELNDSIFNEKNIKKITELQFTFKYEKEKQATELEYQKKDAIHKAKQKTIVYSLIGGFILMSTLAYFLFRSYRFKHKTNIILTEQKREIEELNAEYLTVNEELKQTNEQLFFTKSLVEASEEKLNVIIKNSNDIFVLVNEKGEQFFISDVVASLTGFTAEELAGPIEDVIYPEDIEIVRKHWDRVISDKTKADCIEYRHKHKDKGYVWLEAVAQNFLDNPSINAIVANIRDITERKKTEEALRASEATKNRLFKLERNRIFDELMSNQKTLAASTLKLIQNSERDANTIKQLAEIEINTNQDGKKIINKLISDYKQASFNSNWNEFEMLFEKVHYFFYEKLNAKYPDLTANERKMCAFLKLNMSSKDISQITFQSEDALKKARLRLRQKLGIDRETNLTSFLQNI